MGTEISTVFGQPATRQVLEFVDPLKKENKKISLIGVTQDAILAQ